MSYEAGLSGEEPAVGDTGDLSNDDRRSPLTPRQEECLRLSANMTDKEMARVLGISPKTVSLHISESMRRLGVSSRRAARVRLGENPLWVSPPMADRPALRPAGPVGAGDVPDQPPGFYRPPPSGGVNTSAIIGAFAVLGALVILIFLLLFGYRLL
ncbi:helix-turn-helix transcriptional regulator [Brevundimonas sp.]|uniref:helix-turn-helix domain-containing protein n=1 Tax=Brevundimonas sp. TaxID=1871086 RepID=UPI002486D856|nr:helix-turn-helix transcriptional regulator [Brevundimonas sp.]MDI1282410.1 helix-turn-helix transcriptional regulator [Brevundimonas sp.]